MTEYTEISREAEGSAGHYCHAFDTAITHDGQRYPGRLLVEYKVNDYVLDPGAFQTCLMDHRDGIAPEAFVEEIYQELVKAMFPGYAARPEPWEIVPMLVSYEYGNGTGSTTHTVTLGSAL